MQKKETNQFITMDDNLFFRTDKKFKSIDELINYIDNNKFIDENDENTRKKRYTLFEYVVLTVVGNEIDVMKLIKYYNLSFSGTFYDKNYYDFFKEYRWPEKNTFFFGPLSMYGNKITKLNIEGKMVEVYYAPQAKLKNSFKSRNADALQADYVVLDIETTGLSPVLDDIIQICIYNNKDDYFLKYLPLKKKKTNTAVEINNIQDDEIKDATPLMQKDIDDIIHRFNLKEKTIAIWTSKNLFDRTFLEVYFLENNLKGIENLTFFNARKLLDEDKNFDFQYAPKDYVAKKAGIDLVGAHNALKDCIVEKEIIEMLLHDDKVSFLFEEYNQCVEDIKEFLLNGNYKNITYAQSLYDNLCEVLIYKNGPVLNDYDEAHKTRGSEWIDIHHIDETELSDIATLTNQGYFGSQESSKVYNDKSRLVYSTKVEHFLLHCLINIIKNSDSGGVHFTFGDLIKMETGIFNFGTKEQKIQSKISKFYSKINFEELLKIYKTICEYFCVTEEQRWDFYKFDQYQYDEKKLSNILMRIKE